MNGRTSQLFGRESTFLAEEATADDTNVRVRHYSMLPITELQVGFDWQRPLGNAILSVRAMTEG